MASVRPVPEGFHTVTPHLTVNGASEAIAFYEKAFGAQEVRRHQMPGGGPLMHAQIRIGDSNVMLNDEFPDWGATGPGKERSPVTIHLSVEDVDAAFQRATGAGAEVVMPLADMFWGDRYAVLKDPYGHLWSMSSRIEDPSDEEVMERAAKMFGGQG